MLWRGASGAVSNTIHINWAHPSFGLHMRTAAYYHRPTRRAPAVWDGDGVVAPNVYTCNDATRGGLEGATVGLMVLWQADITIIGAHLLCVPWNHVV